MSLEYKGTNQFTGLDYRFWQVIDALADKDTKYENLFGTSGKLYAVFALNNTSSNTAVAIKFYDGGTATNGTDSPSLTFGIAQNAKEVFIFPEGITFSNGLSMCLSKYATGHGTAAGADLDATFEKIVLIFK
jgi:hypothetical protein